MTDWVIVKPSEKPMVCVEHIPGLHSAWEDVSDHVEPLVIQTRREARELARHINTCRYDGWDKCVVRRRDEVFS